MGKRAKLKIAIMIILCIIIFALIGCAFMYLLYEKKNTEDALASANTEICVRAFAEEERKNNEKSEEDALTNEQSNRLSLMKAMIENDKEELLILVNPWNRIPDDYEERLVEIGDDLLFDERGAAALEAMIEDCKASYDRAPVPISAYRTEEYQKELFDNKQERLLQAGVDLENVYDEAAKEVAVPGTSEHQTGLAIDIIDEYYTELDYGQMLTNTQRWLMEYCYDYGFILRYPEDSTDITGIIYEPWHYRYVGREAAKEISEKGITFEEYLELKS